MKRQPRMKRNCKMAAGVMVFMLAAAMGCGSVQEAENVNTVLPAEDKADENMEQPDQSSEAEEHTSEVQCRIRDRRITEKTVTAVFRLRCRKIAARVRLAI